MMSAARRSALLRAPLAAVARPRSPPARRRDGARAALAASLSAAAAAAAATTERTRLDCLEHDPRDYDLYIRNPTADDLPRLMERFEEHGEEVWPWIWTHPNEDGPHHVFVGVDRTILERIRELRKMSPKNNILLIARDEDLRRAAADGDCGDVCEEGLVGVVSDATLRLLNVEAKLLMLSDERVLAFDYLTII